MSTAVYCPECEAACSETDPICPLCGHELQAIRHKPTAAELREAGDRLREAKKLERAAIAAAKLADKEDRHRQEAEELAARRAAPGAGCPKCGSSAISQRSVRHSTGNALIIVGIPCLCLWGFGIIMIVVGLCITEQRGRCGDCDWEFKP